MVLNPMVIMSGSRDSLLYRGISAIETQGRCRQKKDYQWHHQNDFLKYFLNSFRELNFITLKNYFYS